MLPFVCDAQAQHDLVGARERIASLEHDIVLLRQSLAAKDGAIDTTLASTTGRAAELQSEVDRLRRTVQTQVREGYGGGGDG